MPDIDLHEMVPEPPAELLAWAGLESRIHRHRAWQATAAMATIVVLITGIVIGAVRIGGSSGGAVPTEHHTTAPVITPIVHPNGPILFTRKSPGVQAGLYDSSLYAMKPNGDQLRQITHYPGAVSSALASPDGKTIAYVQLVWRLDGEHYQDHDVVRLISRDGSNERLLYGCRQSCDIASWSPDGQSIAVVGYGLHMIDLNGHASAICNGDCSTGEIDDVSWSPDGSRIVFVQSEAITTKHGPAYVDALWVANSDGSDAQQLSDLHCLPSAVGCTFDNSPRWSPDGQSISFVRMIPGYLQPIGNTGISPSGPTGVYTMTPTGQALHEVWACHLHSCRISTPQWSPDGSRLAFVPIAGEINTRAHARGGIEIIDADGTHPVATAFASQASANRTELAWSPQGDQLVLVRHLSHKPAELFTVRLKNLKLSQLLVSKVNSEGPLTWAPAR